MSRSPRLDSWTYAYDPLDRLTGATNNPGPSETTVATATDAASHRVTNTGLGGGGAMTDPTQGAGSIRPRDPDGDRRRRRLLKTSTAPC